MTGYKVNAFVGDVARFEMVFGPEGPSSVARGVSLWNEIYHELYVFRPGGAGPSGAGYMKSIGLFQRFTPRATDVEPSGLLASLNETA